MKKLAIAVAVALAAGAVQAKELTAIRFGVDPSYAPFESLAPDGKLVGFDIDLGNAICERLKVKCVWIENSFDGMIPALKARKFDGVLSSMSVTEKRQEQISFTDKIDNVAPRLVAKQGSNLLPTPESLKGKSVGVEQGSTQETYARTYWEPKGVNIHTYQTQDLVYQDLLAGRLDAALQSSVQADLGFLKTANGRDFAFAGPALHDPKTLGVGAAIGVRKDDDDLRLQINKALAGIIQDGTYQRISRKYFSFDVYN
ncbi:ABC transporter substrate-binding protein [Paraburkholderia ginsengiterrae]|uniref:ABC transporter substrate-binding protein n=1 Tax=Paraburkholderia ginsengiterrae TaxID=1462993 RepID=A0A1A9N0T5_9BURK|nr:ABC transporter substrate-binding protein [Paraburkholderia ginsengiterrae]OAJ54433.1 ABC transporter substrate-binding protein [Paraburkholderia ginsengiterrae]OAJ56242.1 ABC transporter substrate-binding protein [Paraburkholderia ginsengiterrae]